MREPSRRAARSSSSSRRSRASASSARTGSPTPRTKGSSAATRCSTRRRSRRCGRSGRGPHLYLYVPATYTAWWLLAQVGADVRCADESGATLNPWVFHAANLLMHVVASLLVLQLLRTADAARGPGADRRTALRDSPDPDRGGRVDDGDEGHAVRRVLVRGAADVREVCAAAPWHGRPARADAPERSRADGEAGRERPPSHRARTRVRDTSRDDCFLVLALLAKPAAVVVPVMALIIDRLLIGRSWRAIARIAGVVVRADDSDHAHRAARPARGGGHARAALGAAARRAGRAGVLSREARRAGRVDDQLRPHAAVHHRERRRSTTRGSSPPPSPRRLAWRGAAGSPPPPCCSSPACCRCSG